MSPLQGLIARGTRLLERRLADNGPYSYIFILIFDYIFPRLCKEVCM